MLRIIAVSDSFSHFDEAIKEYIKRMPDLKIDLLKPEKWEINSIIEKETLKIKDFLKKKKWYNIYLDIPAKQFSTKELYNLVENKSINYGDINFIIGWAYGIKEGIIDELINERLSLSKMTLPHSMALLFLLEQIYRIRSIKSGSGYHH